MKKYRFFTLLVFAATLFSCGKQELPYDLEGTKHGVVINIAKKIGSSTTLSTNLNEGDYEVVLSFAPQQGDASMMKEAQVTAVYTDGQKNKKSCYAVKGITSLPATVKIDMKAVCQSLGITEVAVGDRIEFTPSYTLNDGTQVDGWITTGGGSFNNTIFTGWAMEDGSAYSFRVAYTAFAPFQKEKFLEGLSFYEYDRNDISYMGIDHIVKIPQKVWDKMDVTIIWLDNTYDFRYNYMLENHYKHTFKIQEDNENFNIPGFMERIYDKQHIYFFNEDPRRVASILFALVKHPDLLDIFIKNFD